MGNPPQVLILGESVLMDSLAASLEKQEAPQIIRIRTDAREAQKYLNARNPDLILYELTGFDLNPILSMIRGQKNTTHLAIDLDRKQLILLNCRIKPTGSIQDLCDLIINLSTQEV
jgi:hypothetical protein